MSVEAYADSSFLVSLFRQDDNQETAQTLMARQKPAAGFSKLHRVELRNALRNAESFGQMPAHDRQAAFRQIEEDLRDGLLIHIPVNWTDVFRRADELSEKHAAR